MFTEETTFYTEYVEQIAKQKGFTIKINKKTLKRPRVCTFHIGFFKN